MTEARTALVPTPTRTTWVGRGPARSRIATATASAPRTAAIDRYAPLQPSTTMPTTAAALAPIPTPMMSGLARGLRRTAWKRAPASPNAAPAAAARSARGRVDSMRMKVAVGISAPSTMRTASGRLIR
jgi:hypothetical protein